MNCATPYGMADELDTKPLRAQPAAPKCDECSAPAAFRYRWPGTPSDAHLCSSHMQAMADHSDPSQLAVQALGSDRLEAQAIPGIGELAWRVVPK